MTGPIAPHTGKTALPYPQQVSRIREDAPEASKTSPEKTSGLWMKGGKLSTW